MSEILMPTGGGTPVLHRELFTAEVKLLEERFVLMSMSTAPGRWYNYPWETAITSSWQPDAD